MTGKVLTSITPTPGAFQQTMAGAFVIKLNATGTSAAYATYLGGGGNESANAIAVDSTGNAYVAGSTDSSTFPAVNAIQSTRAGGRDAFVTKLNSTGSALLFSTYVGGALDDVANGIALDYNNSVYIVGETFSSDFPAFNGTQTQKPGARLTNSSQGSAFYTKIDNSGAQIVYSSFLGGEICQATCAPAGAGSQTPGDAAYGVAVDPYGRMHITGLARSYTFPLVNSLNSAKTADTHDSAFVTKVGLQGSTLLYSTLLRTGPSEAFNTNTRFPPGSATGIFVNPQLGTTYVTGDADSASNFTPTASVYQTTNGGGQGAILVKIKEPPSEPQISVDIAPPSAIDTATVVTLTATISATGTITGPLVFRGNGVTLGTAIIASKVAKWTGTLPAGIYVITAYSQGVGTETDGRGPRVVVEPAPVCQ